MRIMQLLSFFQKGRNSFTQIKISFCCRVICKVLPVGFNDLIFQLFRNGKYRRVKITNSEVVDLFSLPDLFPDLSSELYNFGPDKCLRQVTQFHEAKIKKVPLQLMPVL